MESIYYVLCWQCHRSCAHCYEDRFHPYHGEELARVVAEARAAFPRVIANFPAEAGKIILAGGEVLHKDVREPILYPVIERLRERYGQRTKLIVQTTGDLVTGPIVEELLALGIDRISVSGLDDFHEGLDAIALREKLTRLFESQGLTEDEGFMFFGATPDSWIGALWPRGRAHQNELSTATLETNFCNRWSGGLDFFRSEVSVDPEGNVYPCCIKTKKALGSLLEEPLEKMLARFKGNPVYEAINAGQPERMGIEHGWSVEKFLAKSETTLPSGRVYRNLCIGCDRFHEEVLMQQLVTIG